QPVALLHLLPRFAVRSLFHESASDICLLRRSCGHLGVFNVWGGLQLYDAARSYNWPHVTVRIIASVAGSKLMGRFDNWYRPRECSPHVFGRFRIGTGAASFYERP